MTEKKSAEETVKQITLTYQKAYSKIKKLRLERLQIFEAVSQTKDQESINQIKERIEEI